MKDNNSSIKNINLSINELDDECIESLGEFIKNNKYIENIIIGHNNITDKGIEILTLYLIGNTIIKHLAINGNRGITDKSIPLLKEIAMKSCLENINIEGTSITKKNLIIISLIANLLRNGSDTLNSSQK